MTEKVPVVLLRGQRLVDGAGQECTGCGRELADGEKAVYTPPSWPSPRYHTLICAACYVPPERFTDAGYEFGCASLTSWGPGSPA